jgi:uncharacterized protein
MSAAVTQVGSIAALWRYPVKSMQGEALEAAAIGDRAYAIREVATGFISSAKHPRKWGALRSGVVARGARAALMGV